MGATVITGKSASAFRASNGEVIYVLFEKTHEKNCYPHTPSWSCRSIGRIDSVIKQIFSWASACEGGMLQRPGGELTPEGYLRSWLKELGSPKTFHNADMTLELKVDDRFSATVPRESAEKAFHAFEAIGRADLADQLRSGQSVTVKLNDDVDIVDALYGGRGVLAAWRVLSSASMGTATAPGLGYQPRRATRFDVFEPEALQLDEHRYLVKDGGGAWRCEGWAYFIVGRYIRSLAESELREPGSYNKRINAYRNAILRAPLVPRGAKVVVDQRVEIDSDYARNQSRKFAEKYPVHRTGTGYEVAVDGLRHDATAMYELGALPVACARWVLPCESGVATLPENQMALFAA